MMSNCKSMSMPKFIQKNTPLIANIIFIFFIVLGIVFFYNHSFGITITFFSIGLAGVVVSFSINNKDKSEEHILFSSLFTLSLFLFTVIIAMFPLANNSQAIFEAKAFAITAFSFLVLSLFFRFGFASYPLNLYGAYLFLFIAIFIAFFALFT